MCDRQKQDSVSAPQCGRLVFLNIYLNVNPSFVCKAELLDWVGGSLVRSLDLWWDMALHSKRAAEFLKAKHSE